jgi:uncharacterized membrane protein YphA (DoxX/SURF4 family)
MSYSHRRFRRLLAVIRILFGIVFLYYGATKLFDPDFFARGYSFALSAMRYTVAQWYTPVLEIMIGNPAKYAFVSGMVELFLGIGLLLGLAVRPVSVVGMLYVINKMVMSWHPVMTVPTSGQYLELHLAQLGMVCLFLIFAVEHAGETWGLGSIYHAERARPDQAVPRRTTMRESEDLEEDFPEEPALQY